MFNVMHQFHTKAIKVIKLIQILYWAGPPAPGETGECETGECETSARMMTLPSTVGVRRLRPELCSRRRTERETRERRRTLAGGGGHLPSADTAVAAEEPVLAAEEEHVLAAEAVLLTTSPVHADHSTGAQNREVTQPAGGGGTAAGPADPIGSDEIRHSGTPEPAPAKSTNRRRQQQQPRRKQQQQQQQQQQPPPTRVKPEPATQKPERGRKVERGPLKRPWENPKPSRARSKSRDRSATRGRPPAASHPQADKLNTSLGFNDTFDFDCEGAVHLTPFKVKAVGAEPRAEGAEQRAEGPGQHEDTKVESHLIMTPPRARPSAASTSSPSSPESEGELYVPRRGRRRCSSPERSRALPGRRGRRDTTLVRDMENLPAQQRVTGEPLIIIIIIIIIL